MCAILGNSWINAWLKQREGLAYALTCLPVFGDNLSEPPPGVSLIKDCWIDAGGLDWLGRFGASNLSLVVGMDGQPGVSPVGYATGC